MTPKLPSMTGRELIVLLQKAGFKVIGQRGQHVSLRKGDRRLIIPYKEKLAEQTMLNIIEQAELSASDILNLLHSKGGKAPVKDVYEDAGVTPEEVLEDDNIPIMSMGFSRESYYAMSWTFPWAIIRAITGVLFLIFAFQQAPWANFGWFTSTVTNNITFPTIYQAFFNEVVQFNLQLFGWLNFLALFTAGVCLLFGAFTVLGGSVGALWVLQFGMGAVAWPHEWEWTYVMWCLLCLGFAMSKAGRSLGADLRLAPWLDNNKSRNFVYKILSYLS